MNKLFNGRMARVVAPLAAGSLLVLSQGAQAAIDVTAATTGIADASTAVLSVLAALITMAAAIFGVTVVYRKLKSGG